MKNTIRCRILCALAALVLFPLVAQAAGSADNSPAAKRLQVISAGGGTQLALEGAAPFHSTSAAVTDAKLIAVPSESTVLLTWTEQEGAGEARPFYAISLDGQRVATVRQADYTIKLRHGDFTPQPQQAHAVADALAAPAGSNLFMVQFATQPLEVFHKQVIVLGGVVRRYLPNYAYVVEMSPAVRTQVEKLPYVRWVGPFHTAYRLNEELQQVIAAPAGAAQRYHIEVFEKGIRQKNILANEIAALGGTINILDDGGNLFDATLTPAQLAAIVERDEVAFIDPWTPPQSRMNNVRTVGGANYLEGLTGWTGQGVRGEVMDNGCQAGQPGNSLHPDFTGRLTIRGNTNFVAETHGTATFGIIFGSGAGNASARGMLPGGTGYFNDWTLSASRYTDVGQLITAPYNCVFQSNSWGYSDTSAYTSVTRELDDAVFDFDIVVLHSQGNSGNQAGVEHAWGKNVVGVGGVDHFNNANVNDDRWNFEGTIGPASDGRIKPDLCFYYDSILTTYPTSSYTGGFGGTSAACPETAGHFGLMFQMWKEGIFGNPVSGGTVFQERPHCATARALMFNTAKSYNFTGTGVDLTRTHQGWGLPDVKKLYDLRNNMLVVNETQLLTQTQSASYTVQIVPGQPNHGELRATLVYADPPGTTSASQHRINKLNLKVIAPNNTVYWGNNGLLAGNWSTSGGVADTLNTTENVFLQNPAAGKWTVLVIATDINQDGHVETPQMDADYALVISGGSAGADCNTNGVDDVCDIDCGAPGCNVAGCGQSLDCNNDDFPDECELVNNDCNQDGIPDDCELAGNDCNSNGVPDECDLSGNDCNGNNVPDSCDQVQLASLLSAPAPQTVCPGDEATFSVTGPPGTAFVWNRNGAALTDGPRTLGSQTTSVTIMDVTAGDAGFYSVTASDGCISVESAAAELRVMPTVYTVTQEPVTEVTICASSTQSAVYDFHVDNELGAQFQWYRDGTPLSNGGRISGANTSHLQISPATPADAGQYTCTVSNSCGATASSSATRGFLVFAGALTQQPRSTCASINGRARYHVGAQAVSGMQYFWYRNGDVLSNGTDANGMIVSGATTPTLTLDHVPAAYNGNTIQALTFVPSLSCVGQSANVSLAVGSCGPCPFFGDVDGDLDVDLRDMAKFMDCFGGTAAPGSACECANVDAGNNVVDMADWQQLTGNSAGPF